MKKLWFDHPADSWSEAWPIGNGRLGGMVFGGIHREILQLNQDSMYYGGPINRVNPSARENLERIRALLLEGRIPEAEALLKLAFTGAPQSQRHYQPLGTVELLYEIAGAHSVQSPAPVEHYCRQLDLDQGMVRERYLWNGCQITKEYFASYPEGVMVLAIESQQATLDLDALLSRVSKGQYYCDRTGKLDACTIFMEGALGEGGVAWRAGLRAQTVGGDICVCGEHLLVQGAQQIRLYLGCETSFYEADWKSALLERLDRAAALGYPAIKQRHLADYQQLFGRVSLVLENEEGDFASLYFQYARYLMIAGSRPGSLPLNLQGIWNDYMEPPWGSRYTININTEMNYWPAEACSLPECHMPLFDHLLRMWENGKQVAREMYGCRGFVAHHNTDLWGDCAPQDAWIPSSYWVMGGAWLCTHIWQHYLYTGDRPFLRKLYPVLKDAVLFFHDFLVEVEGQLMTCPSVSPENTYLLPSGVKGCYGAGAAMDSSILRDLMEGYLKASEVLGIWDTVTKRTAEILKCLPALSIGKYGQIMEWREDYEEEEPGHRHISQLYALHPSHQITPDRTPALALAARRTLERRLAHGGGHTGWSCAWIVSFYARLGDGEEALTYLRRLWENSTFPNLMDTHPMGEGPVFQIDGNMGAAAAILELLVQSDETRVLLLPALPSAWPDGSLRGVTVAGGIRLQLKWKDRRLCSCCLYADSSREVVLVYQGQQKTVWLEAGNTREQEWPW